MDKYSRLNAHLFIIISVDRRRRPSESGLNEATITFDKPRTRVPPGQASCHQVLLDSTGAVR